MHPCTLYDGQLYHGQMVDITVNECHTEGVRQFGCLYWRHKKKSKQSKQPDSNQWQLKKTIHFSIQIDSYSGYTELACCVSQNIKLNQNEITNTKHLFGKLFFINEFSMQPFFHSKNSSMYTNTRV